MQTQLFDWARRWGVPEQAIPELATLLGTSDLPPIAPPPPPSAREGWVQGQVRMRAPYVGMHLWRNNVGALKDERGVPVRYGLANDSKQLNDRIKSGDLIGIRRVTITPAMVGHVIGQFVSRECKAPGWRYTGTPREKAQLAWASLVQLNGGDAGFIANPDELR